MYPSLFDSLTMSIFFLLQVFFFLTLHRTCSMKCLLRFFNASEFYSRYPNALDGLLKVSIRRGLALMAQVRPENFAHLPRCVLTFTVFIFLYCGLNYCLTWRSYNGQQGALRRCLFLALFRFLSRMRASKTPTGCPRTQEKEKSAKYSTERETPITRITHSIVRSRRKEWAQERKKINTKFRSLSAEDRIIACTLNAWWNNFFANLPSEGLLEHINFFSFLTCWFLSTWTSVH